MKRIAVIVSLLFISGGLWRPVDARAQASAPVVIGGTTPISAQLRADLESYLAENPPSTAPYYAPTYFRDDGPSALVSLAGLNLQSPDETWHMEARDGETRKVIWIGTVRIFDSGGGELISANLNHIGSPKLAMPALPAPGGGTNIHLPFDPGKSMQYGPRLIHGSGDYGTTGMYAVDLVGGDSLGTNVASRNIYASALGTVDYVCDDDTSVAVRTVDEGADNTFVYAHLLTNANLVAEHEFAVGAVIGALRYGAFDDTCGWAEQAADIYHVHWMFEPASGTYAVGGYTILLSDGMFHTASTSIGSGGWIINNASGSGADDPGGTGAFAPSIWDAVVGAISKFVNGIASLLPDHTSASALLGATFNTIMLFFRLVFVLVRGKLNLVPIVAILVYLFATRISQGAVWFVFWAIRVIRLLKQTIAF